jgi:hypothetical protein
VSLRDWFRANPGGNARNSLYASWASLICSPREIRGMKQIHVWPNHVRVPHLDLVLARNQGEPLSQSMSHLARLGLDTRPGNVEIHAEAPTLPD